MGVDSLEREVVCSPHGAERFETDSKRSACRMEGHGAEGRAGYAEVVEQASIAGLSGASAEEAARELEREERRACEKRAADAAGARTASVPAGAKERSGR